MSEAVVKIKSVEQTNKYSKTITFDWDIPAKPGQFIMVWAPDMDEIPLSLSSVDEEKSITFKVIGKDTECLASKKEGDRLRVRGPYGNGYDLSAERILVVGGGIGIAPITPVLKERKVDAIFAARDADEVEYAGPLGIKYCRNSWICTDDGSLGEHCNAVQMVQKVMEDHVYDMIIACGPEVMLYFLLKYCNEADIQCQMSLERYMKCGCGVCGACMIDEHRVCKDGPVFTREQINGMKDFGTGRRDASGAFISFK